MMYAMKTTPQSSQFNVGGGWFKEIDLPISALIMARLALTARPKSELSKSTQTMADGGCSIWNISANCCAPSRVTRSARLSLRRSSH